MYFDKTDALHDCVRKYNTEIELKQFISAFKKSKKQSDFNKLYYTFRSCNMKVLGRYDKIGNQIVDTHTGEIIDTDDIKRTVEEDLLTHANQSVRTLSELGINAEVRIIKDKLGEPYEVFSVKENHEFNKIFRVDVNYMFENSDLSIEAAGFLDDLLANYISPLTLLC